LRVALRSKTYECQAASLQGPLKGLGRSAEADATLRLAAALTVLKQDPKNEDSKIQAKAIREEIEALCAEERRAESQTQQQTAKDVRGPEISRAAQPSLLSKRLKAMFARKQAAEQQKTANAGEKEEAVSLHSKPLPHEEVAEYLTRGYLNIFPWEKCSSEGVSQQVLDEALNEPILGTAAAWFSKSINESFAHAGETMTIRELGFKVENTESEQGQLQGMNIPTIKTEVGTTEITARDNR
jgi:hypothetical protein